MSGVSIMCDKNSLVYLLDGDRDVARFLENKQIYVSIITELELFGKRSLSIADNEIIESLLANCFIVDINREIKQIYKKIKRDYSVRIPNAVVAATAIYLDFPLLTLGKDFEFIPNLKLMTWK